MRKLMEKIRKGEAVKFLVIGDSITLGSYLSNPKQSYISVLEEKLKEELGNSKIKIINTAVSGYTTQVIYKDVFFRKKVIEKIQPDLVLMMMGKNDLIWGVKPGFYRFYLQKIIQAIRKGSKAEIVLVTPPKLLFDKEDKKAAPYLKRVKAVAEKENVHFIDGHTAFDGQDLKKLFSRRFPQDAAFFTPGEIDFVHPNERGHRLLAEKIMKFFIEKKKN